VEAPGQVPSLPPLNPALYLMGNKSVGEVPIVVKKSYHVRSYDAEVSQQTATKKDRFNSHCKPVRKEGCCRQIFRRSGQIAMLCFQARLLSALFG